MRFPVWFFVDSQLEPIVTKYVDATSAIMASAWAREQAPALGAKRWLVLPRAG